MLRSASSRSVFKKHLHSPIFQNYLTETHDLSIDHQPSTDYSLCCYYDAIPYLQFCRERRCGIRDTDGPLTIIFNTFAEAVEPMKQINNNKLTFEQINEANQTICLLELLMFCDYFGITSASKLSRFEVSALLKVTLKMYPNLNKGVLNQEAFCDLLTYLAIFVFSRPPLQCPRIETNSKKISAFLSKFRLNDMDYVNTKCAIPKSQWKHINVVTQQLKKKSVSKIEIKSSHRIIQNPHDSRATLMNLSSTQSLNASDTTQSLKHLHLKNHHFMKLRHLLRRNVSCDWRQYKGQQINMETLRFSELVNSTKYKFKISVLNCSSHQIRLDVQCESQILRVRFNGGYFSRGMRKSVFLETVDCKHIRKLTDHEKCSIVTVCGVDRKGKKMWECLVPIYYRLKQSYESNLQQFLQQRHVLPACVTPFRFH